MTGRLILLVTCPIWLTLMVLDWWRGDEDQDTEET